MGNRERKDVFRLKTDVRDWFVLSRSQLPAFSDACAAQLHERAEKFSCTTRKENEWTQEDLLFLQGLFILPEIEELRKLFRENFNFTTDQDEMHSLRCPSRVTMDFFAAAEKSLRGFVGNLLLKHYGLWAIYYGREKNLGHAYRRFVRNMTLIRLAHARKNFVRLLAVVRNFNEIPDSFVNGLLSVERKMFPAGLQSERSRIWRRKRF